MITKTCSFLIPSSSLASFLFCSFMLVEAQPTSNATNKTAIRDLIFIHFRLFGFFQSPALRDQRITPSHSQCRIPTLPHCLITALSNKTNLKKGIVHQNFIAQVRRKIKIELGGRGRV